jgi:hypothetical protein
MIELGGLAVLVELFGLIELGRPMGTIARSRLVPVVGSISQSRILLYY